MKKKTLFPILLLFFAIPFALFSQCNSAEVTVAKDGSGDYTSIQTALDHTKSFPDQPITIFVKKGIYEEKVRIYAWNTNLTIEGESREETIISWDDHFKKIDRGRNSTFHTYTLWVEANNVSLKNLTIRNTAGPVGQAISLSVSGDRVAIRNCRILGHQDTLYCAGENSRQYFKDCYIEGTTDFIFGNATAVFENCELRSLSNSFITAASTTPRQEYGLVFLQCRLTAGKNVNKVYLGRPWRAYAKTVFIDCDYGDHILPEGWDDWGKESHQQTVFYAEWASRSDLEKRVKWSKKLTNKQRKRYTLKNIFSSWQPGI